MKNPLTPAGIEPVNFRFVAQYLNHCATAVPSLKWTCFKYLLKHINLKEHIPTEAKLISVVRQMSGDVT